ncbi:hypothetical protein [Microbacterium sp. H1-D42]|uniref:hypothetical protein n=1 Tax=Microbacterium sp. H1-D42 TaxID=2925844 RepID=UPI001F53462D|nr:hypothetical protein [Microbacterium sp. H1-D42]UNK69907.1 hypothetical protein MNR00_12115 [Microbacterium sp. H1-D42]
MTKTTALSATSISRIRIVAIIGIVIGLLAVLLAAGLDWSGFGGGLATGAGIGVMLVSVYFWGYANGVGRPLSRSGWRPSADSVQ